LGLVIVLPIPVFLRMEATFLGMVTGATTFTNSTSTTNMRVPSAVEVIGSGEFRTPHGQCLDTRDGISKLAACDRANKRLQWFDMEGKH